MPIDIRPLKPHKVHVDPKPHLTDLCQRCIELGQNCRDYVPPPNAVSELVDIPDDQSIISEASTASTSSFQEDQQLSEDDLTPVVSDEEETDRFLELKMKQLKINTK